MPKISELNPITSISTDDLLLVVNDPNGAPSSNKITFDNFANSVFGYLGSRGYGTGYTGSAGNNGNDGTVYSVTNVTTSTYHVTETDTIIFVNPTEINADVTIILPINNAIEGRQITVKNIVPFTGARNLRVITQEGIDSGDAAIESPETGDFIIYYDLPTAGESVTWIHNGEVWRTAATLRSNPIFYSSTDAYHQVAIINDFEGINASADLAIYNNFGDYKAGTGPYIDLGIESSNYSNIDYSLYGFNDGYLYVDNGGFFGGNLLIGTAQDSSIIFHANGTTTDKKLMSINSLGVSVSTNTDLNWNFSTDGSLFLNSVADGPIMGFGQGMGPTIASDTALSLLSYYANTETNEFWEQGSTSYPGSYQIATGYSNSEFNSVRGSIISLSSYAGEQYIELYVSDGDASQITNRYWKFHANGHISLPGGGKISDNFDTFKAKASEAYDQITWNDLTITFNNASSNELQAVLAILQVGDRVSFDGYDTTVMTPYTGGLNGSFTVNSEYSIADVQLFQLPDRRNLIEGIRLTTNYETWTFGKDGKLTLPNYGVIKNKSTVDGANTKASYNYFDTEAWGGYAQKDIAGGNSSWSWIETNLNNSLNPYFLIENQSEDNKNVRWTFDRDGKLTLPRSSIISETANTLVLTPPGAVAGQSLVIRPTTTQTLTSDHPSGFTPGDVITITFTPNGGSFYSNSAAYTFTGCTQAQLGRSLTGSLVYSNEETKTLTWTIPSISDITSFTFTINNFVYPEIPGVITLTRTGSISNEPSHIHLVSGNTVTTDLYLGDDDQYVKIEKNSGNVVISTSTNTKHWTFDNNGILTLPVDGNIYNSSNYPLLDINLNALNINTDGGTASSIFATGDEMFTGGGSTTIYGDYEASLDGGFSYNNKFSTNRFDGGGAMTI